MVRRRRSLAQRRLRRLFLLGGAASGITALRGFMMARNEKRYADVISERSSDPPR